MDKVSTLPAEYSQERADQFIDYLFDQWEILDEMVEEWPSLSADEKEDFLLEWSIPMDREHSLTEWSQAGKLTPEQQQRYEELLALHAEKQPILEKLKAA